MWGTYILGEGPALKLNNDVKISINSLAGEGVGDSVRHIPRLGSQYEQRYGHQYNFTCRRRCRR